MSLTARELNRATLGRQMLLGREPVGVAEAVRRVVAIQAQQAASPYVALWNRVSDFDPADLDAAFSDHKIVKATLMRMTLHAVHADDYPTFRESVEPSLRASRLGERFTSTGLTTADADALVSELLEFAVSHRTAAEIKAWLEERVDAEASSVWQHLRGYVPLWHAPTGETWTFGHRPSYVAANELPVLANPEVSAKGLKALVRAYLEGFGPATVGDVAQFAMVQQSRVKGALQSLSGGLKQLESPEGEAMFDVPGTLRPDGDTPAPPHLMAMWDSVLLAYSDRSRIIPPEYRKEVIRKNGDVLPTLLVDGYVVGVWRAVAGGIEALAFHPLPDEVWEALAAEARSLVALFVDRQPEVYRRYDHWWNKLPGVSDRILLGE